MKEYRLIREWISPENGTVYPIGCVAKEVSKAYKTKYNEFVLENDNKQFILIGSKFINNTDWFIQI